MDLSSTLYFLFKWKTNRNKSSGKQFLLCSDIRDRDKGICYYFLKDWVQFLKNIPSEIEAGSKKLGKFLGKWNRGN